MLLGRWLHLVNDLDALTILHSTGQLCLGNLFGCRLASLGESGEGFGWCLAYQHDAVEVAAGRCLMGA